MEMENNIITQTEEIGKKRTQFKKGNSGGPGRKKLTEEQKKIAKIERKAIKEYLSDYEQKLAEALPSIHPALIKKAKTGNVPAIREIHEVLGAHKNKGGGVVIPVQINFGDDREKYK